MLGAFPCRFVGSCPLAVPHRTTIFINAMFVVLQSGRLWLWRWLAGFVIALALTGHSLVAATAPKITGFTPTSGVAGTTVTLTGTAFTGATAVKFNGKTASSFKVASATSITAVAPTGVTTGKMSVTTAGGTATSSASFTVAATPTISAFTVAKTPITASTSTTLTVTFTGGTGVVDNGIGSVISGAAKNLTPAITTTYTLTVSGSGGTVTKQVTVTVVPPPTQPTVTGPSVVTANQPGYSAAVGPQAGCTYAWTFNNGTITAGAGTSQIAFTPKPVTLSMITARAEHSATLLPNGKVLLAGGTDPSFNSVASVELYAPSSNTIALGSKSMLTPRASHTATLLSTGKVLVVGGYDAAGMTLASAELYDPATGAFTAIPKAMAVPRMYHSATLLQNGKVLVAGGYDNQWNALASAVIYDPSANAFTTVPGSMATPRGEHATTLLNSGLVLIAGGYDNQNLATLELFNPSTNAFTSIAGGMSAARVGHSATLLPNGNVLLAGGSDDNGRTLISADIFDSVAGSIKIVPSIMQIPREGHTSTLLSNGKVLLLGGWSQTSFTATAECFDPSSGLFSAVPGTMSTPRGYQTITLASNGQVVIAGGNVTDGTGNWLPFAGAEVFDTPSDSFGESILRCVITNAAGTPSISGGLSFLVVSAPALPLLTAPAGVLEGSSGNVAYTQSQPGCTYAWSISNGTITSGDGTPNILFTGGLSGTPLTLACAVTNAAGTLKTANATSTVTSPFLVTVYPSSITLDQGAALAFSAIVAATSDQRVTWTASAGSIDANGLFTAPNSPVQVTVKATSTLHPTQFSSAIVTVRTVALSLNSAPASLPAGTESLLTSQVTGTVNRNVNWTVISGNGYFKPVEDPGLPAGQRTFFAPYGAGTVVVKATSAADPTKSASKSITITQNAAPGIHTFTATPAKISPGQSSSLQSDFGNGTGTVQPGNLILTPGTPLGVSPQGSTTYSLQVTSPDGTMNASASVNVGVAGAGSHSSLPSPKFVYGYYQNQVLVDRNGKVLLIGGMALPTGTFMVERFDPATYQWTTVGTLLAALRDYESQLLPNGQVLIIPGWEDHGTLAYTGQGMYLLNPDSGSITTFNQGIGRRLFSAVQLNDGGILVAGGTGFPSGVTWCNGNQGLPPPCLEPKSGASIFYPNTLAFTSLPDMNQIKGECHGILLLDGRVLLSGNGAVEVFDPSKTTFTLVGSYPSTVLLEGIRPDGKVVLSTGQPTTVKRGVWDPTSGQIQWDSRSFTLAGGGPLLPNGSLLAGSPRSISALLDPDSLLHYALQDYVPATDHIGSVQSAVLPSGLGFVHGSGEVNSITSEASLIATPAASIQNLGIPVQFSVSGTAANGGVIWSASGGIIRTDGTFTASKPGLYLITAFCGGARAHATLRVVPTVSVSIVPAPQAYYSWYYPNGAQQYHAGIPWALRATVLDHPNTAVTWSLKEGAAAGTITSEGVYTGMTPGTFHIVATSIADPNQSATLAVTVFPSISLALSPTSVSLNPGDTVLFTAQEPSGDSGASWSLNGVSRGVGVTYSYLAPVVPGIYTLTATSNLDPAKTATATITVVPITAFYITPSRMVLAPGQSMTVQAYVASSLGLGNIGSQVSWTATAGACNLFYDGSTGKNGWAYRAPATPGTYTLQATIVGTPTSASATVMVVPASAFTTNSQMAETRSGHSLTRLLDGQVLVAGGYASTGTFNTAEIYDPIARSFSTVPGLMNTARALHSATLLPNGKVLLVGGSGLQASAELFDPATGTLTPTKAPPLFPRYDHFSSLLPDGRVLLAGGTDGYSDKSMEIYDPALDAFLPAGYLNRSNNLQNGGGACLLLADGRVLIAGSEIWSNGGGDAVGNTQSEAEVFDFRTGISTTINSMKAARSLFSLVQPADGSVWVLGGTTVNQDPYGTPSSEQFDGLNNTFALGPSQFLSGGTSITELADGSFWSMGWLQPSLNGYLYQKGMRLFPDSKQFEEAIVPPMDLHTNPDLKTVLLPTGDVLAAGKAGAGFVNASLLVFDTASAMTVFPHQITLVTGCSRPFQASATGFAGGFTWSVLEGGTGGSVTSQGVYTAPFEPGTYHVVATASDGSMSATATVTVIQNVTVSLSPLLLDLTPGTTQPFLARVIGAAGAAISWSSSSGTIAQDGTFTAPAKLGVYTVTATTNVSGNTYTTTATVTVTATVGGSSGGVGIPPPLIHSFSADTPIVAMGQPVHLSWSVSYPYKVTLISPSYLGYPGEFMAMDVTGKASVALIPQRTESYQLQATSPSGTVTSQVITINVSTLPVIIGISPSTATLYASQSMNFGFTLTAPTNRMVWACTGGTITQGGAYTAPALPGTYIITVTSVDDPGKSASATVTVIPFTLSMNPVSLSLPIGGTKQFGYSFTGPSDTVLSWTATGGTVTANGFYTAPGTAGTCTVTVTCPALNLSASATLTVVPITLSITPTQVALVPGQTQQFGWSVNGGGVTFSVLEAGGGSITQTGLYSAPAQAGMYTVQVTSLADPTRTAQAKVTVNPITITITPPAVTLEVNQSMQFGASLNNGGWTWSTTGGVLDDQGRYRAPLIPGSFTVTVQSVLDASKTATSQVTVVTASTLRLTPNEITISCGGTIPITPVGIPNGAHVTWSVTSGMDGTPGGGTLGPDNVFTAGDTPGSYFITAMESSDGARANSQVQIISHRVLPENGLLGLGQQLQFTAEVFDASPSVTWSVSENNGGTIDTNGLYTAPLQQGQYHVIVQTSSGNLTTVPVMVGPPDGFTVTPEISILTAGTYEIRLLLKASNGKTTESLTSGDYTPGMATPAITFSQGQIKTDLGVDGPYTLEQMVLNQLVDGELLEVERKNGIGYTGPYVIAEGDKPWITIGEVEQVIAEDTNSNGLIDTLKVQFTVNVICDGMYSIGGGLVSEDGSEVDSTQAEIRLTRGPNVITIPFSGEQIYSCGKSGSYGIKGLTVTGPVMTSRDFPAAITGFSLDQFEH